jgi:ABC-type nitrate/sulfonate/bicarbonate transport system permease component
MSGRLRTTAFRRALVSLVVVVVLYGVAAEAGSRLLPRQVWLGQHYMENLDLVPTYPSLAEELVYLVRSGLLPRGAAASTGRVVAGLLLGAAVGVPLGLAMARRRRLGHALAPWVALLRFTPAMALLPLYVLWLGVGEAPKILLIATAVAVVTREGAAAGVRSVAPVYLDAAAALGAPPALVLRRIVLPAALPHLLASLRIAVGLAWVTMVVAELIAPEMPSLGYLLALSNVYPRVATITLGIATIGLLVLVSDALTLALYQRATRWMRRRDE